MDTVRWWWTRNEIRIANNDRWTIPINKNNTVRVCLNGILMKTFFEWNKLNGKTVHTILCQAVRLDFYGFRWFSGETEKRGRGEAGGGVGAKEKKVSVKPFQIVFGRRIHSKLLQWMLFYNIRKLCGFFSLFWLCACEECLNRFGFLFVSEKQSNRDWKQTNLKNETFLCHESTAVVPILMVMKIQQQQKHEKVEPNRSYFGIMNLGLANYFITIFRNPSTVHQRPSPHRHTDKERSYENRTQKKATTGNNTILNLFG